MRVLSPGAPTPIPFERIHSSERWRKFTRKQADTILTNGWSTGDLAPIRIDRTVDWGGLAVENRSWRFRAQSWEFMGPPLSTFDQTGEDRYFDWAFDAALGWCRSVTAYDPKDDDAWYDMAIGLRGYRLGFLIDVARRRDPDREGLGSLLSVAEMHFDAFEDERKFASHSNHGLYFATGQAALSRRLPDNPRSAVHAEMAQERLTSLIGSQFGDDGVHREHSPNYHLMVLETVRRLAQTGLITAPESLAIAAKAESQLPWFTSPTGSLIQFGDSVQKDLARGDTERWETPEMLAVVSQGKLGSAPENNARTFPSAGYWVVRERWPDAECTATGSAYLGHAAAFHSRVHKHADDLSFVYWDRGHEILTDAGRYGYLDKLPPRDPARQLGFFYRDPNRQYVESTRAHNTVEIDGRDFARHDVEPFGSAIRSTGAVADIHYCFSEVTHFSSIRHTRLLATVPGSWVLIYDKLADHAGAKHDFRQRLNFAPELSVQVDTAKSLRINHDDWSAPLVATSLSRGRALPVVLGGTDPMLGWVSRQDNEIIPAPSTGFEVRRKPYATLVTLLSFEDTAINSTLKRFGALGGGDRISIKSPLSRWRIKIGPVGKGKYVLTGTKVRASDS